MEIRTLIVDDEPLARQRVRDLLESAADVRVVGECADGEVALEAIEREEPELLFLDIQMPEVDGFELLEALAPERMPVVVFVTAYDEFALRAFEAHAIDYLLKPFYRPRFEAALERARAQVLHRRERGTDARLRELLDSLPDRRRHPERFVIRNGPRIFFVRTEEVDWIGAEGNYARLHVGERSHLLRETMTRLEERLDPARFLRVSRSAIVNVDRIVEVQALAKGSYVLLLRSGAKVESSSSYRRRILELIDPAV